MWFTENFFLQWWVILRRQFLNKRIAKKHWGNINQFLVSIPHYKTINNGYSNKVIQAICNLLLVYILTNTILLTSSNSSCSRLSSYIVPHDLTIVFLSSFLWFTLKQCQTLLKSLNHLSPNLLKTNPSGKECTRTFLWDRLIYIGGTKHSSLKYRHSLFHCGLALLWCLTRYVDNDYDKRLFLYLPEFLDLCQ